MSTLTPAELEEPVPGKGVSLKEMELSELRGLAATLEHRNRRLEESLLSKLSLEIDNIGWKPLGDVRTDDHGFDLNHIKKQAELGMALATANPLVKRGLAVRTSYIWGKGVRLSYPDTAPYARSLRRTVGKVGAQFELERTLGATGNLFFEVTTSGTQRRVRIIPMEHIDAAASLVEDSSVVAYVRLSYDAWTRVRAGSPGATSVAGAEAAQRRLIWVPTTELEGPPLREIEGVAVDQDRVIKHVAVNRMSGWWWGVPDLYAVTFWVRAYKKYLEQCHLLNEAYAQIAFKVASTTRAGTERAAAEFASDPGVDPATGQPLNIGGTAVGMDVVPVQHGRPVDFSNGLPLAAMVAAGLEIPLQVMTSDPGTGGSRASDATLDEATKKAMQARQQFLNDELTDLAQMLGQDSFEIEWPRVGEEPLHRTVQALDMAGRTGMLYPAEWRDEFLKALGRTSDQEDPPAEDELPVTVSAASSPDQAGQDAPAQIEPPSYGDHELRDQGDQQHTEET